MNNAMGMVKIIIIGAIIAILVVVLSPLFKLVKAVAGVGAAAIHLLGDMMKVCEDSGGCTPNPASPGLTLDPSGSQGKCDGKGDIKSNTPCVTQGSLSSSAPSGTSCGTKFSTWCAVAGLLWLLMAPALLILTSIINGIHNLWKGTPKTPEEIMEENAKAAGKEAQKKFDKFQEDQIDEMSSNRDKGQNFESSWPELLDQIDKQEDKYFPVKQSQIEYDKLPPWKKQLYDSTAGNDGKYNRSESWQEDMKKIYKSAFTGEGRDYGLKDWANKQTTDTMYKWMENKMPKFTESAIRKEARQSTITENEQNIDEIKKAMRTAGENSKEMAELLARKRVYEDNISKAEAAQKAEEDAADNGKGFPEPDPPEDAGG